MIILENGYQIAVDELNSTLQKRSVSEKGTVCVKTIGYYTTLESAIEAYFRISVSQKLDADTFTLKEAAEIMRSERQRMENMLR